MRKPRNIDDYIPVGDMAVALNKLALDLHAKAVANPEMVSKWHIHMSFWDKSWETQRSKAKP